MPLFLDQSKAGKYIKIGDWIKLTDITSMGSSQDIHGKYLVVHLKGGKKHIYRGPLEEHIKKNYERHLLMLNRRLD